VRGGVRFGQPARGRVDAYVGDSTAGIAVRPVLGSRSTDFVAAGLGPFRGRALAAGD
jgi:allophanate hydrolase subunit 2